MTEDLYQLIADVIDREIGEDSSTTEHLAREVCDLLIDLAGTGQLLASIDRIARKA